jgi:hypothetical protein
LLSDLHHLKEDKSEAEVFIIEEMMQELEESIAANEPAWNR